MRSWYVLVIERGHELHELCNWLLLDSDGSDSFKHLFKLWGGNLRFGHGVNILLIVRDRELFSCFCERLCRMRSGHVLIIDRRRELHELRFGLLLDSDWSVFVEHLFELRGGKLRS